jgi:signal transduction histidine kinase
MIGLVEILYIFILVVTLIIAFLVLFRGKGDSSKLFFLLVSALLLWIFTNFMLDQSESNNQALFYIRLTLIGPIFIGPVFLNFIRVFPTRLPNFSWKSLMVSITPGLVFIPLIPTELNVVSVDINSDIGISFTPGPIYIIFLIYIIAYGIASLVLARKRLQNSTGIENTQLKIFVYSFFISLIMAILGALVLPIIGLSELSIIGPFASLVFVISTSYTLLRHGLFDIRVLLGRIIFFSISALFTFVVFYIVVYIEHSSFDNFFNVAVLLINVVLAYAFVVAYSFFTNFIRNRVDSAIINPGFDPNKVIASFNNKINTELNFEKIIDEFISVLHLTVRPMNEAVLLGKMKSAKRVFGSKTYTEQINQSDILTIEDIMHRNSIKQITSDTIQHDPKYQSQDYQLLGSIFKKHDVALAMSIALQDQEMSVIYILSYKEGRTYYSSTELDFLRTLADILSVTLARSFLYEEVKQFNLTLQKKVDEATKELALRNDQLGEQLRKERDMMDILGHELRTPLGTARNAIIMIDSMRNSGNVDNAKYEKYMDIAVKNIRREKDLLETILQSARLENNRIQMNLEKVSLKDVIEDAVTAFKDQAEQKGLLFTVEIQPQEAFVNVDRTAIQQVIDNLVSNAVKYTYEGSVKVQVLEEGPDHLRVNIIDTGEGIAKEDMPNIGKKFFRANTHLGSEGKIGDRRIVRPGGTGIGLYVIKGLLNQFGSELEIQSELGKGSTFSFILKKLNLNELETPKALAGNTETDAYKQMKERSSQRVEQVTQPQQPNTDQAPPAAQPSIPSEQSPQP